jgi:Flp pilus assembly protein TadG
MIETSTGQTDAGRRRLSLLSRWRRDTGGVTAIEFAIVAMPFMMMLFGIIAVGLYFFTLFCMDSAVEQAARLLRTGQAQQAAYTAQQFKTKLCEYVPGFVDCATKVKVNVLSFQDTTDITADSLPKCLGADNNLSSATSYSPGTASQVVLVWVCYEWELAGKIPFLRLGDMASGSALIQSTSVFRTEPFDTN